eukprot:13493540-Alexandrium_andersonii.AAC.1
MSFASCAQWHAFKPVSPSDTCNSAGAARFALLLPRLRPPGAASAAGFAGDAALRLLGGMVCQDLRSSKDSPGNNEIQ